MLSIALGLAVLSGHPVAPEAGEPKTLRWMGHWKGEGPREQLVREVLEDFSFQHQELNIEFAFAADVLPRKSQAAAARYIADMIRSGNIDWDVVWLDQLIYRHVAELLNDPDWGKKHLVDFNGNTTVRQAHKPCVLSRIAAGNQTGGMLTGPYIEGYVYALYYNKALARKLKLQIPKEEMRAEDLLRFARQIQEYNRTTPRSISLFLYVPGSGGLERLANNLYRSIPPEEREGDGRRAVQRVRGFFEALGRLDPLDGVETGLTWQKALQALMEDRALFIADATWRSSSLQAAFPDQMHKIGIAQMPGFDRQEHYVGGFLPVWAVMKNGAGREAGIQLMEYWCRPEIIEKWERYTRCPSGLNDGLYDAAYSRDRLTEYQRRLTRGRSYQPDIFLQSDPHPSIAALFPALPALLRNAITEKEQPAPEPEE